MASNRLCLNPSKTKCIWVGSSRRLQSTVIGDTMMICGSEISISSTVRDLGVMIDSELTMKAHVNKVSQNCFFHLRQLRQIRNSLSVESAHALVRSLIHSRLDYCNGVLAGAPNYITDKLQSVLRASARLVLGLPSRAPISQAMHDTLHWLPYPERVNYKLCTLTYKSLHSLAPGYLSDHCNPVSEVSSRAHLRSAASGQLIVPRTKTKTLGPRGFYHAAPAVWNSLPSELRDSNMSLKQFQSKLKTHYFRISYTVV